MLFDERELEKKKFNWSNLIGKKIRKINFE